MEDRNIHFESIREHLIPGDNISIQQHGGEIYKVKSSRGGGWGKEEKKVSRIDGRLDCGMSRA